MDNHEHSGNSFFNGFLLGAIIGAAVVFFLFTNKGKKLLKTIMEEGSEGFSELKDLIQEEMEEEAYDEEEGLQPVRSLSTVPHTEQSHVEPIHPLSHPHDVHHQGEHHHEHHTPTSPVTKRFFKGAKK